MLYKLLLQFILKYKFVKYKILWSTEVKNNIMTLIDDLSFVIQM